MRRPESSALSPVKSSFPESDSAAAGMGLPNHSARVEESESQAHVGGESSVMGMVDDSSGHRISLAIEIESSTRMGT